MCERGRRLAKWLNDRGVVHTLAIVQDLGAAVADFVRLGKRRVLASRHLRLAGQAYVERIGEALGRLPSEFRDDFPEVRWREIRAMRVLLAHQYTKADDEVVWTTLARDVPELLELLELDRTELPEE